MFRRMLAKMIAQSALKKNAAFYRKYVFDRFEHIEGELRNHPYHLLHINHLPKSEL